MTNTVFVDAGAPVDASWFNDVNTAVYSILGNGVTVPASVAEMLLNMGLGPSTDPLKGANLISYSEDTAYATAGTLGKYLHTLLRTGGTRCLALGAGAGLALSLATDVVAIGPGAGASLTTGFGHVLIGTNAGAALTSPGYCVAIGMNALQVANQPSNVNLLATAVGAYALNANAAGGQYNSAFGAYAGQFTTTGYFNTFLGTGAGRANTIGFSNTFLGHSAGLAVTGASNFNTFAGDNCGFSSTQITGVTALGYQALSNNTTGNSFSVVLGVSALAQSNSPDPSVAIGYQAGYTLTTAGKAVLAGYFAYNLGQGTQATAIGHQAAALETGTGNNNTWLGYRAGYTQASGFSNVLCLGANSAATRSNQVMLGDGNVTEVRTAGYMVQKLVVTGSTLLDNNLELAFYYINDTHFGIKLKGSDGVVRNANGTFLSGGFVVV